MGILDQIGSAGNGTSNIPTDPGDSRFNEAKNLIRAHGGDPRATVLDIAKQKGINLDPNFNPMDLLMSLLRR